MTPTEYLNAILSSQQLEEDGSELKSLRQHRDEVEKLISAKYPTPSIRYGGSKAKGTMILESYDLDLTCYFPSGDTSAGDSLEDIYDSVKVTLADSYGIEEKGSAIRLRSKNHVDFHIDVVPGRFTDDTEADVFLHRTNGDKERLKTNLQIHIDHVKDSGRTDAIKLVKLWRTRNGLPFKTFVLELIVIDILKGSKASIEKQVLAVLTKLRDEADDVTVEDPANPTGNDLSEMWSDSVRAMVSSVARSTISTIESTGWEAAFGQVPAQKIASVSSRPRIDGLREAARSTVAPSRPWRAD